MATEPDPLNPDDDNLAERLADALVEKALLDPWFRLSLLRHLGLLPERLSRSQIAAGVGLTVGQVRRTERTALLRLRHRLTGQLGRVA